VVAAVRLPDYEGGKVADAVGRVFDLAGGVGRYVGRGDKVLIKPNFIVPRPREAAAQTDPAVIVAVAALLKEYGAEPFVGDSPAWGSIGACVRALGLDGPLGRLGVPVRALNRPVFKRIDGSLVGISRAALEADRIINVPKLKAHQQLGATIAVKNMFGCVCGKSKAYWHWARGKSREAFCTMLIEIYRLLGPAYSVIDAVVAMEGQGPIGGTPRQVGFLIGGDDAVACETVCCDLIGLVPEELPILQGARRAGFGCSELSRIEVRGDDYRDARCGDFRFAEQTPLNFTLPRVCRSVCKQVAYHAKGLLARRQSAAKDGDDTVGGGEM